MASAHISVLIVPQVFPNKSLSQLKECIAVRDRLLSHKLEEHKVPHRHTIGHSIAPLGGISGPCYTKYMTQTGGGALHPPQLSTGPDPAARWAYLSPCVTVNLSSRLFRPH